MVKMDVDWVVEPDCRRRHPRHNAAVVRGGELCRGFEGARAPPEHGSAPSHCQKHPFIMKGKLYGTPSQNDIQ